MFLLPVIRLKTAARKISATFLPKPVTTFRTPDIIDKLSYNNYTQISICGIVFTTEASNLESGTVIGDTLLQMMCAEDIMVGLPILKR